MPIAELSRYNSCDIPCDLILGKLPFNFLIEELVLL